jgi:D-amino-acid oxidase
VPRSDCDVLVVGAGVSGLTTAVCLAEAGMRVTILAAAPPAETTSSVAGAIWGPHLVEDSPRTARWALVTLAQLREFAADPATGVRIATGVEATRGTPPTSTPPANTPPTSTPPASTPPAGPPPASTRATAQQPPDWMRELGAVPCAADSLPGGFASGWRYGAPLVRMPAYLGYLHARFEAAGGRVEAGLARSLTGAGAEHGARAVVNCTGSGARHLVSDQGVRVFRGQVVVAENPGVTEFFIGLPDATTELVYLFPHGDILVLGGTEVADDWNPQPVPGVAERILRDCAAIDPRVAGARVLGHRVGLRPFRPQVRLEAEPSGAVQPGSPGTARAGHAAGPAVVHNYGHGGAGITLSWGCAREAAALVTQAL